MVKRYSSKKKKRRAEYEEREHKRQLGIRQLKECQRRMFGKNQTLKDITQVMKTSPEQ